MNLIENLRQYRILDYAIFDFAASFIGVYFLAPLLSKLFLKINIKISRLSWLYLTLPLSILIHLVFNQMTQMTQDFLSLDSHFVLKLVILGLLYLGLKDVKFVKK
jgi:hypothetical protein